MSLIEVLVAMIVLALGLLSALGLQLRAHQLRLDTAQQTLAATLAHDLAERMRGNASARSEYLRGSPDRRRPADHPPSPSCSDQQPCNPTERARHDLWQWWQYLNDGGERLAADPRSAGTGGLVDATACISAADAGHQGLYRISLAWRGGQPLPENREIPCGLGALGNDGHPLYGAQGEYRRSLSLAIYLPTP